MQILDIALGLVFVYLVLSLACTALNELLAGVFNSRGKALCAALRELLADPQQPKLADQFFAHPLVAKLFERNRKPAYLPARTFALTLIDLLAPASAEGKRKLADVRKSIQNLPVGSNLRRTLSLLLDDAQDELQELNQKVEIWFNSSMDRVSAWYKQRAQIVVFVLACGLCALINADTIQIARTLSRDAALRAALVAQAQAYVEKPPASQPEEPAASEPKETPAGDRIRASIDDLKGLGIPLGWTGGLGMEEYGFSNWLAKIVGLFVSALAVSLGAPFWFDTLNRFINIRAAGRSPEERPKPPEAQPKRVEERPPQ